MSYEAPGTEIQAIEDLGPLLERAVLNELCSGRCFEDYRKEKLARLRARRVAAFRRQQAIAKFNQGCQTRFVEGMGQWLGTIDPEIYFGQICNTGREDCWSDPDFRKDMFKKNEFLRAPRPAPKFVVVDGFRDVSRRLDDQAPGNGAGHGAQGDPADGVTLTSAHVTAAPPFGATTKTERAAA